MSILESALAGQAKSDMQKDCIKLARWAKTKEQWFLGMKRLNEKYPNRGFDKEVEILNRRWVTREEAPHEPQGGGKLERTCPPAAPTTPNPVNGNVDSLDWKARQANDR